MARWILSNISLKIGSIVIALLLWFHVVTERWVVETVTAPIKFQSLPADLVVVNNVREEVQFQVRTKIKQLILLNYFGNPFMRIDLSEITRGSNTVELSEDLIVLPSWRPLEVVNVVSPKKIAIEAETKDEKKVPVIPVYTGTPLEGNAMKSIEVVPDSIVLLGGESKLRGVHEASTDTIDISGRHEHYSVETGIVFPEGGYTSETEVVMAHITFERYRSKTLSGIEVTLKGDGNLSVFPGSLEVTVMGPETLLNEVTSKDIRVFVDAQGPGTDIVPFFNLPDGIAFKSCNPSRVEVRERRE